VRPDAAVVAVPNHAHVPVGLACVQHGVHVLVEKPLAPTVAEGRLLVDAAKAAGVICCVGHHRRFDPAVVGAKRLLEGIGPLLNASVMWRVQPSGAAAVLTFMPLLHPWWYITFVIMHTENRGWGVCEGGAGGGG
jgi:predicted dehydrogenase